MSDENQDQSVPRPEDGAPPPSEHLNIKVTDNNNEVFFKIKRSTALKKLMDAFCDRQGKMPSTVRFLFDGVRVSATDTPDTVGLSNYFALYPCVPRASARRRRIGWFGWRG